MKLLKITILLLSLLNFAGCSLFAKKDKTVRVKRFDKNLTTKILEGGNKSIEYSKCPEDYASFGAECILTTKVQIKKLRTYKREFINTFTQKDGHKIERNFCKDGFAPIGNLCTSLDKIKRYDREISEYKNDKGPFKFSYKACPNDFLALGAECIFKKDIHAVTKYHRSKNRALEKGTVIEKFDPCEGGFIASNALCVRVK